MFTTLYMEKYGVTRAQRVSIAIKNQGYGHLNSLCSCRDGLIERWHFFKPWSIVNNPPQRPAAPVRRLPGQRRAAAVVLTALDKVRNLRSRQS
jgi:hypothetical protein